MTTVLDCLPKRVTRVGRLVMVEFSDNEGALELEQGLLDAHLAQRNPGELRRRYEEKNGIRQGMSETVE